MSDHTIMATGRNVEGKGASRRLRRSASIPAVVYGGSSEPKAIQLDHEKIWQASQNEWFYSSILTLDIEGASEQVLLRDMQRHPFKQLIMHLDFQRVNANEAIRVAVPLHFIDEDKSPAGKASDIVVLHELNEVTVSCLPKDLPEFIDIDLSTLSVGDIIHLSDLKLPKGVEIPELKLGKEHDVAVVIAKHGQEDVEEPAAAEEEGEAPDAKADQKGEK